MKRPLQLKSRLLAVWVPLLWWSVKGASVLGEGWSGAGRVAFEGKEVVEAD